MELDESYVLGVDIGGSHITVAPVDFFNKKVLTQYLIRARVDSTESATHILEAWTTAIKCVLHKIDMPHISIGIAMPGPFNYPEGICLIKEQQKYRSLYGINLKAELSQQLNIPAQEILFINDAIAFLAGEIAFTTQPANQTTLVFTIGTGLGSAMHKNGESLDMDLWNMTFKKGIAEDYFSARWIMATFKTLTAADFATVLDVANVAYDAKHIYHHEAKQVFDLFGENFYEFLKLVCPKYKPDVIIVNGNIAKSFSLFARSIANLINADGKIIPVFQSALGELAGILGAGMEIANTSKTLKVY